jgi:hypothetical protein
MAGQERDADPARDLAEKKGWRGHAGYRSSYSHVALKAGTVTASVLTTANFFAS